MRQARARPWKAGLSPYRPLSLPQHPDAAVRGVLPPRRAGAGARWRLLARGSPVCPGLPEVCPAVAAARMLWVYARPVGLRWEVASPHVFADFSRRQARARSLGGTGPRRCGLAGEHAQRPVDGLPGDRIAVAEHGADLPDAVPVGAELARGLLLLGVSRCLRPPLRSLGLVLAARPSMVRSTIRSCSNSANAARMVNSILPMADVVSMGWSRHWRLTPRCSSKPMTSMRLRTDRPIRSSLTQTSASPPSASAHANATILASCLARNTPVTAGACCARRCRPASQVRRSHRPRQMMTAAMIRIVLSIS